MSNEGKNDGVEDHGRIVRRGRGVSWVWLFPLLAIGVAGWLMWTNWKSQGPEIEIHFADAPGIEAGKTSLIYRGVVAGKVTGVHLEPDLKEVVVTVRLKAYADELAREETDFWIDQPVISLKGATGLESIIQGNSIQARVRGGRPAWKFQGREEAPLDPLDAPGLIVNLKADSIPFLDRATPVYHRGMVVGAVRQKKFGPDGRPHLQVALTKGFEPYVLSTSRFWILPATSLTISPRGASINLAGLDALIQGGIAFEQFSPGGEHVADGAEFQLYANDVAARAEGPEIAVDFDDGRGLLEGETPVCYLGQPIGLVETVRPNPAEQKVEAVVRLYADFRDVVKSDAVFTIVRPRISIEQGVSGLDTLVTGAYIAVEPGTGSEAPARFAGRSVSAEQWEKAVAEREGVRVTLTADRLPNLERGAPVLSRGIEVGSVLSKEFDGRGRPVLKIVVRREHAGLLRENSQFWRVPATSVTAGPGVLNVDVEGIASLIRGGVAFETFGTPGSPVSAGSEFRLFDNERLARATSDPFRITFDNGRGLLAGKSELRYLGLPVGLVENVRTVGAEVEVTARLDPGYDFLRRNGSVFAIVQPRISLTSGVTGLETILSGVYIECSPGAGEGFGSLFTGLRTAAPQLVEARGMSISLSAPSTNLQPGARVFYRDVSIGEVTGKALSEDRQRVILSVKIDQKFRNLIRENSQFWDDSAITASIGFIKLKVHSQTLIDPKGKVGLATPAKAGAPAREGTTFDLLRDPPRFLKGE